MNLTCKNLKLLHKRFKLWPMQHYYTNS